MKVVAVGRLVQSYLWWYGRQVGFIVRWLLLTGKYSCDSDSMIDSGCYCKLVAIDRKVQSYLW